MPAQLLYGNLSHNWRQLHFEVKQFQTLVAELSNHKRHVLKCPDYLLKEDNLHRGRKELAD